jgi:hypothetical protein
MSFIVREPTANQIQSGGRGAVEMEKKVVAKPEASPPHWTVN